MAFSDRYSPIYSGVWSHDALEGTPFEEKAFFIFLWSNERNRPSGIYRVTDEQLAADTGLRPRTIRTYLDDLSKRGRIVRDGNWIFVRGYLNRQPNQPILLKGARQDVAECASATIVEAFRQRYPLAFRWSGDGQPTIRRPSRHTIPDHTIPDSEKSKQSVSGLTPPDSDELSLSRDRPDRTEDRSNDPEPVAAILKRALGFRPA
jgi:hypothetical protein